MRLFIARHGKTNYNDLGLCNADPSIDVHLTEAGWAQAIALGEKLRNITFDVIYVSELRRTQQTAEYINKFQKTLTTVDARLNDNRTGYEGRDFHEYYAALDAAQDRWSARFNDGESLDDVKHRTKDFIEALKTTEYQTALVITSMVIAQTMYGLLNGLTNQQAWDFQFEQGTYIELEV